MPDSDSIRKAAMNAKRFGRGSIAYHWATRPDVILALLDVFDAYVDLAVEYADHDPTCPQREWGGTKPKCLCGFEGDDEKLGTLIEKLENA